MRDPIAINLGPSQKLHICISLVGAPCPCHFMEHVSHGIKIKINYSYMMPKYSKAQTVLPLQCILFCEHPIDMQYFTKEKEKYHNFNTVKEDTNFIKANSGFRGNLNLPSATTSMLQARQSLDKFTDSYHKVAGIQKTPLHFISQ